MEKNKIYVISSYGDIITATTNMEIAKALSKIYSKKYDKVKVTVVNDYDNDECIADAKKYKWLKYEVMFRNDKDPYNSTLISFSDEYFPPEVSKEGKCYLDIYCWVDIDEDDYHGDINDIIEKYRDKAIDIAKKFRSKYLIEKLGL